MAFGKFYAPNGRVFSVSTVVAGLAIPISTTTAPTVALRNPRNSGVELNLLRFSMGHASGNTVASVVGLQFTNEEDYTVFADSQINPAQYRFGGASPRARASAAGTNTLAAAVVNWGCPMFELDLDTLGTSTSPGNTLFFDFEGLVRLQPGQGCFVAGNAASVTLFAQTLWWEEVPIPELPIQAV